MRRLIATGSCKTDEHVRALLKYLGVDQQEADRVIWLGVSRFEFEDGTLSFADAADGRRLFELRANGEDAIRHVHDALTESTKTHTFHWRCHFSWGS